MGKKKTIEKKLQEKIKERGCGKIRLKNKERMKPAGQRMGL